MDEFYTPAIEYVNRPWSKRSFCPRAATLIGKHNSLPITRLVPIRCKCWTCDYCAEINATRLKERVLLGKPTKFITLTTCKVANETPAETSKRCRKQIARLLTMIRKEWGDIQAAIILELTKKGLPHWHLCARCGYIPQHWLSEKWASLTGARVVDIRKIKNPKNAVNYVAKYTSKTAKQTAKAKIGRLFSFTSNYLMREQTNPRKSEWTFKREKQHPLEVLRKWPGGRRIFYHDGLFDLIDTKHPDAVCVIETLTAQSKTEADGVPESTGPPRLQPNNTLRPILSADLER